MLENGMGRISESHISCCFSALMPQLMSGWLLCKTIWELMQEQSHLIYFSKDQIECMNLIVFI